MISDLSYQSVRFTMPKFRRSNDRSIRLVLHYKYKDKTSGLRNKMEDNFLANS